MRDGDILYSTEDICCVDFQHVVFLKQLQSGLLLISGASMLAVNLYTLISTNLLSLLYKHVEE